MEESSPSEGNKLSGVIKERLYVIEL